MTVGRVDIETTLVECHVFADLLAQIIQRTHFGLVLGQRRRRLTGIEPTMGCDAGPTLNRNLHPLFFVYSTQKTKAGPQSSS